MFYLQTFIHQLSPNLLSNFLSLRYSLSVDLQAGYQIDDVMRVIEQSSVDDYVYMMGDVQSIVSMSGKSGRTAIATLVDADHKVLSMSGMDRSCWVFLHERDIFLQAQQLFYTDIDRQGYYWSGYQILSNQPLCTTTRVINRFTAELKKELDITDDVIIHCIDDDCVSGIQIYIGLDNDPYIVVYEKSLGRLDVVANERSRLIRFRLAVLFDEIFLKQTTQGLIQIRRYHLSSLLHKQEWATDPEDGIESVEVVMLTLKDIAGGGYFTFALSDGLYTDIYDYVRTYIGCHNPLTTQEFIPVKATILIRFFPDNEGVARVLPHYD